MKIAAAPESDQKSVSVQESEHFFRLSKPKKDEEPGPNQRKRVRFCINCQTPLLSKAVVSNAEQNSATDL